MSEKKHVSKYELPLAKITEQLAWWSRDKGFGWGRNTKEWLVLSEGRDPFWFDRPAAWRDGQWLADTKREVMGTRRIHPRGLHYVFLSRQVIKPNGERYGLVDDSRGINNLYTDWVWLGENAIKSARWCGLIPMDEITDERNDAPIERLWVPPSVARLWAEVNDEFELVESLLPNLTIPKPEEGRAGQLVGKQPYHLVFIGEKSSLYDVLSDEAERYGADLYLPTGEISDYYTFRIAANAVADGRPMVLLYFADCDPSGHQMSISVTRKLQALQYWEQFAHIDGLEGFGKLGLIVSRAALTPDQVTDITLDNGDSLPQSPVTQEDRRRENWTDRYGVEQTEIDALLVLQPDLLRDMVAEAVDPYFDATLANRVRLAELEWVREARQALDAHLADRDLSDLDARLGEIREELPRLAAEATDRAELDTLELPEAPDTPTAELDGEFPEPLFHSEWPVVVQTLRLQASKRYEDGGVEYRNGLPVRDDEDGDE
jgi:hypothetical protein